MSAGTGRAGSGTAGTGTARTGTAGAGRAGVGAPGRAGAPLVAVPAKLAHPLSPGVAAEDAVLTEPAAVADWERAIAVLRGAASPRGKVLVELTAAPGAPSR